MLCALTKFKNFAFKRQCVHFIPQIRSFGELPHCLFSSVLKRKTALLEELKLTEDHNTTSILNTLENAKVFGISPCGKETNEESLVQGITVSDLDIDTSSIQPSTIYVRKFYPALLNCLLKTRYSILTGNPGISKSWFHWYILHQMVNKNVVRNFEVPKLIVRQIARDWLVFIFTHNNKAFITNSVSLGHLILFDVHHDAVLILVEPGESKHEPIWDHGIQTILTCSPDQRRYKEYQKHGAEKIFMPVWSLDELQIAGAHIHRHTNDEYHKKVLTPEGIANRYYRFGGIFRHVIPVSKGALESVEKLQVQVLGHTKPVDTFVTGTGIEKIDDHKDNISDMLLQYKVNYEKEDFKNFKMVYASEYVKMMMEQETPNDEDFLTSVVQLNRMFRGGRKQDSYVFEHVVYHGLKRFKWKIFCKDKQEWVDRKFEFKVSQLVEKEEEKFLKNMQTYVLYRPLNPQFPLVDMLWVELNEQGKKEFFGVQVTFAEEHSKPMSTYENVRQVLDINPEEKLNIYFVTNPRHVESYAKRNKVSFISGATLTEKTKFKKMLDKLEFSTIKTCKFDLPFVAQW